MSAEFAAQGRQHALAEGVLLPGAKAPHQRKRDDFSRYPGIHRLLHRPAALAGVLHVAGDVGQLGAFVKGIFGPLQHPRSNDTALVPQVSDFSVIE